MQPLPQTVELENGEVLYKQFGFYGIGMYKYPGTGKVVVIDLREEVGTAEA